MTQNSIESHPKRAAVPAKPAPHGGSPSAKAAAPTPSAKGKGTTARTPGQSPVLSTGFALMSLLPILLTLYLVSSGGADPLAGRQGIILGLMLASAISGFLFIKAELGRVFHQVVHQAGQHASGDLKQHLREISRDEVTRISAAIETLMSKVDGGSEQAAVIKQRFRDGLGSLADAIRTARDSRQLLELLTDAALDATGAKTAYFVGVDEDEGDFYTMYATGEAAEEVKSKRIPLGEGVPGLTARERGPLLLDDLDSNGKGGLGLSTAPETTIAAPVHLGETLLGVLILHDRQEGGRFGEADVAVISSMATFSASALRQQKTSQRLATSFDLLVRAFSKVIEQRDPYARGHADRVALYCEEMAHALKLDDETILNLRRAAYLHGIGRISLPEALLRKDDRFTDEELDHVRAYPVKSAEMLQDIPALAPIVPMVRHHLEQVDGTGVPDQKRGEDIPLTTHILIVANAFDAMTSDRSYRQARSLQEAFRRLKAGAGTLFDERAVKALTGLDEKILKGSSAGSSAGAVKGQGAASISVMD